MADLQNGTSKVFLTGRVKLNNNSLKGVEVGTRTGYNYVRINFGVETSEGNTVYCELMGGYGADNIIHTMNTNNEYTKVNWADRNNPKIIESISDYRIHKIGLTKKEDGTVEMKKFLSPIDIHDYLKENLKNDMEVTVTGKFAFSEYNGETQRKIEIQNIYVPFDKFDEDGNKLPVKYQARFVQTLLIEEDAYKKLSKKDVESGEIIVPCYATEYISKQDGKKIKKTLPFLCPITVKINPDNPELTKKVLGKVFDTPKGKLREVTIEGNIIQGYESGNVGSKDIELTSEIIELIEMGLYTEEEAKSKLTVRGSKVNKLVFNKPQIKKSEDGTPIICIDDTKYEPEDLYPQLEDDNTEDDNTLDSLEDEGSSDEDMSWMDAL